MTNSLFVPALACIALTSAGCSNRGADDRVEQDLQRTDQRGPGYAVVAWRQVDRARLSGNVVILTNGEEPVFVRQAAAYHVPVADRKEAAANTKVLLERLQEVEAQLSRQCGVAMPAPAASPATPAEPVSAPEIPVQSAPVVPTVASPIAPGAGS